MIRVAVIGAGWVTRMRHVPSLLRDPRVKLVGVVDHSEVNARALASALSVSSSTSLDAAWLRDVDAVTVGTPPDTHFDVVMTALRRGWHVLTEKPFASTPDEGRQMIAAASAAGRTLGVVHNFQFARSVLEAHARLRSGELGALQGVFGLQFSNPRRRLPSWYKRLPAGLFSDEAPHLFYLVRSFVGPAPLANVSVVPSSDPGDPTPRVVSTLQLGAAPANLQMFFTAALSEWHLVVMGSRKTVVADIFRDILVHLPDDGAHGGLDVLSSSAFAVGSHLLGTVTSGVRHATKTLDYGNNEVIRRFVDAIADGRPLEGIAAEDGLAVVESMTEVVNAARR